MGKIDVPERDASARANLDNLLRVIYDGRQAIACQYGHEEYADPERALAERTPSEA